MASMGDGEEFGAKSGLYSGIRPVKVRIRGRIGNLT